MAILSILFSLPVELLEEISFFLTRSESVPLLTVNHALHNVFARRIWRNIGSDDQAVWSAPSSAWDQYGHLVRSLCIDDLDDFPGFPNLPHLLHLDVHLTDNTLSIFDDELPHLQRLVVRASLARTSETQKSGVSRAMSWIAGAESRGQEVNVDWHLVAFSRDNSEWIDDFLSSIDKPEQHSISLDQSISTFSIKQVSKLASMLVAASFPTPMSEPVTDAFNSLFAIGQDDIVFQRVRQLNLELPLSSDGAEDSIVPDLSVAHFPALESLNLGFTAIRNRQFGINVVPGIWASITTLRLECCYDAYWNIIAKCVPNLRILRFNFTHLTLDLALMAKYMPQLENLEVGEGCDVDFLHNEDSKSAQLLNLYSFEVDKSESVNSYLSLDEFEFIVHNAPNLQSVKFAHGWFEGSTLDELNGAVNASVRNLFVSFYGALIENDDFDAMISVFPNLAKLELDQDPLSEELFSSLRERYPSINIRHVTL